MTVRTGKKTAKKTLWVRGIALALAVLMLCSVLLAAVLSNVY